MCSYTLGGYVRLGRIYSAINYSTVKTERPIATVEQFLSVR